MSQPQQIPSRTKQDARVSQRQNRLDFFHHAITLSWSEYDESTRNNPKNWEKLEEFFAQRILQNTLSGYIIRLNDTGAKSSMYDFLVTDGENSIAIEVTQHTSANEVANLKFLDKCNHFPGNGLQYDWTVFFKKNANISDDGRKKLARKLKELENKYPNQEKIDCNDDTVSRQLEVIELKKSGFIPSTGKKSPNLLGSIKIPAYISSGFADIFEIFKIMHDECYKSDNIKKLKIARTNERHLFIAITGFNLNASSYLKSMPYQSQRFEFDEINKKLEFSNDQVFLPEHIDVIWVATLIEFHPSDKPGYRLVKITNCKTFLIFEPITSGIALY